VTTPAPDVPITVDPDELRERLSRLSLEQLRSAGLLEAILRLSDPGDGRAMPTPARGPCREEYESAAAAASDAELDAELDAIWEKNS
jgi:hypothetical protein